jgi:hypothetical protein
VTKRYDEPIEVTPDRADGPPAAFTWRGRRYEIVWHIASWREAGEWHDGAGRYDREYFRVLARQVGGPTEGELMEGEPGAEGLVIASSAVFDLYLDLIQGGWKLSRMWD